MSTLTYKFNVLLADGVTVMNPLPTFTVHAVGFEGTSTLTTGGKARGFPTVTFNSDGTLPAYTITAPVPGTDPAAPLYVYTIKQGATLLRQGYFTPIETSTGIVNLNILLTSNFAKAVTPKMYDDVATMLANGLAATATFVSNGNAAISTFNTNSSAAITSFNASGSGAIGTFNTSGSTAISAVTASGNAAVNSFNTTSGSALTTFNTNAANAISAFNVNGNAAIARVNASITTTANALTAPIIKGTTATRQAADKSAYTNLTFWRETDGAYRLVSFNPGDTVWRDVYGNDPDAAAPPPDTGVL